MSPNVKNQLIATWNAGDSVQGFAFLKRKEVRQDKSGRDYLDLELADSSGSITGRAWSDSSALTSAFAARGFVKFRGQVQSYRDQLQIKVDQCRPVVPEDVKDGFDEGQLVPSTKFDLDDLWSRLTATLEKEVTRPEMRRLATETLEIYGPALKVHPAAKAIHHAFRGGLLEHVVSMIELAVKFCDHYAELDRDLMMLGVLFHDLGKLQELGAMPDNEYTPVGRLVGHIVIGRDLVRERTAAIPGFPADLRLQLEHLVLSHQGKKEYSSPVEPMTAEGFALHAIDDLDSKLAVVRGMKETGKGFVWARSLERFVWLGEGDGSAESPEGSDAGSESAAISGTETEVTELQKRIF
ncbi:MAG: HD domain-containing protein [Thermoanaerobaculia bacterium]